MNIFQMLKELGITPYEFMEAPDKLSDNQKIMFILTFKAIRKAQKIHAMKRKVNKNEM